MLPGIEYKEIPIIIRTKDKYVSCTLRAWARQEELNTKVIFFLYKPMVWLVNTFKNPILLNLTSVIYILFDFLPHKKSK